MNALVGTGALIRLIVRRDRFALLIWIVLPAFLAASVAAAFNQLYPTPQALQTFAAQVATSPVEVALLGPVFAPTLGGLIAWRWSIMGIVTLGLFSLFTVIRHTRTDEEAGRRELLGSTVVGRHAALSAALIVTFAANLLAALLVAAGLIGIGLPAAGSLALGLAVGGVGWMIASVAGLAAQLTESAGEAQGIAGAVLGLFYLLHVVGAAGENSGTGWLSWVSPVGWAAFIRAFAGERWWVLALLLGTAVLLVPIAFALAARRDIGAGLLPTQPGPAAASPRLRTPLALAWRLQRGILIAWIVVVIVYGTLLGSVAGIVTQQLADNPAMMQFFSRLGGGAQPSDVVFSLFFALSGLVIAVYAIQAALRLRSEEVELHAELLLSTAASRLRWVSSHLAFAAVGPAIVLAVFGLAGGLTYGLGSAQVGYELPRVLAASMAYLPALWVLVGLTAALFGLLPRFTSVSWAGLAGCVLIELGRELDLVSQPVLDISPFTHVPQVLMGQGSAMPLAWLVGVAVVLAAAGLVGFRRRDVGRV
jgi:ABC-2 type transport system permease protein